MLFQTENGAILEIFWRERGSEPWSRVTALRFLSRYRTDRKGLQGLRWLLSDRTETGPTWRAPDADILQRTAWLIATNSVLVADYGWGEDRWPGSGFILGSSWDSSILFWRDQIHVPRDLFFFEEWIKEMLGLIERTDQQQKNKQSPSQDDIAALKENANYIASFRRLLASAPGMPDFGVLSDRETLRLIRMYLASGELLPIYHRYPGVAEPGPGPEPPGPKPPGPKPGPEPIDPDDPDDPPPPICLLNASKLGSPFLKIEKD
jgi:hypothetical protein